MKPRSDIALRLALAGIGARVRLVSLTGSPTIAHRLTELGLTPGVELEILQQNGGNFLLAVGDTRLAIGCGLAHTVLVEPINPMS